MRVPGARLKPPARDDTLRACAPRLFFLSASSSSSSWDGAGIVARRWRQQRSIAPWPLALRCESQSPTAAVSRPRAAATFSLDFFLPSCFFVWRLLLSGAIRPPVHRAALLLPLPPSAPPLRTFLLSDYICTRRKSVGPPLGSQSQHCITLKHHSIARLLFTPRAREAETRKYCPEI